MSQNFPFYPVEIEFAIEIMSEKRKLVIKYFLENPSWSVLRIAKEAQVCRQTAAKVIKNFKKDLTCNRKPGSGRPEGFHSLKKVKKAVALIEKNPNISNRKCAQKVGLSEMSVRRIKIKNGLRSYKVQTVPDRNAQKNQEAKTRAKKLKVDFFQKKDCCIMDDETYVLCSFSQLPGQEFYISRGRGNVPKEFRTKKKTKFPRKFLVWQAICSCGMRSKCFVTSGTINSEIYVKECLQKRLLPFVRQHNVSTFFWPDLASCHYSKATAKWYEENNIVLVPREANPPNCPELRPIERYWALVKRILKLSKQEAKTIEDFKKKWTAATKKVLNTTIIAMMSGIPEKIHQFCVNKLN